MADVTIKYKGSQVAELAATGAKTLQTSGKYCEGDIAVEYAPRSKTYEITLAKASGWVLLTTLDSEVKSHINDPTLVVTLVCISDYAYQSYAVNMVVASNRQISYAGNYPAYGVLIRQTTETAIGLGAVYYKPNKSDTSTTLGSGMFRLSGSDFYVKPWDGYLRGGTYRLTFTW